MRHLIFFSILLYGLLLNNSVRAEKADTLRLSRDEAVQLFTQNSLVLIAAHYNIDIAHSQVIDAKLLNNPYVQYSQHLYDPTTKKLLDNSSTGQWDLQISQLFSIAGRHSNTVKLAKLEEKLSEQEFKELVRSLLFELNDNYSRVAIDLQKQALLDSEIEQLKELLTGEEQQVKLGVVPANELLRLQAELQETESNSAANFKELRDAENDLFVLLNMDQPNDIIANLENYSDQNIPSIDSLQQLASQRPDVLISHTNYELSAQNLRLQKSLAWPDLTLNYEYDLNSSFIKKYNGIGLGLPLPLFNRNQGRIHAANYAKQQAEINDSIASGKARNEIYSAFTSYIKTKSLYEESDHQLSSKLDEMNRNAFTNYKSRYISLLDFLDQIRTYTQSYMSQIDLQYQCSDAANRLNYSTGKTILNP